MLIPAIFGLEDSFGRQDDARILNLVATVIECCEPLREPVAGHPLTETARVLATLRQFLREGTLWRSLGASAGDASGSTLRRWLDAWTRPVCWRGCIPCSWPCCSASVRAKRGGDLPPIPCSFRKRGYWTGLWLHDRWAN